MPFVTNQAGRRPQKEPTPLHITWAARLRASLANARMLSSLPSTKRWADEFRILSNLQEKKDIEAALEWVVANVARIKRREKGVPPVQSAGGFRRHYQWVHDMIHKEEKSKPRTVSKKAEKTALWLGQSMSWPKGSKAQLPGIVEDTLAAVSGFMEILSTVLKRIRNRHEKGRLTYVQCTMLCGIVHRVQQSMGTVDTFTERWFTHVHKRILGWKDWSGDLTYFTFSPTHKEFDRMGKEWATEYAGTGGGKLWTTFTEIVNGRKTRA